MKLNKTKVRFILRQYRKHVSTKEISRDVKVSQRRVQQIIKQYKETGLDPVLGEKIGRSAKPYYERESEIVRAAHHSEGFTPGKPIGYVTFGDVR